VECTDPLPDEFLDMLGLFEIPIKNLVIPFILSFIRFDSGLENPKQTNPLEIDLPSMKDG